MNRVLQETLLATHAFHEQEAAIIQTSGQTIREVIARFGEAAEAFQTNRPKIERILNRALEMGALASLEDRPGRGRKPEITAEALDASQKRQPPACQN